MSDSTGWLAAGFVGEEHQQRRWPVTKFCGLSIHFFDSGVKLLEQDISRGWAGFYGRLVAKWQERVQPSLIQNQHILNHEAEPLKIGYFFPFGGVIRPHRNLSLICKLNPAAIFRSPLFWHHSYQAFSMN
ncbi:hypothetical protein D4L85_24215 [Chryseolinea soli]|uniref:Uncharacterized protein n=1 Tax=Chryseolinea soli TaxID=2321403 RepID=A0A385ST54_9BACT|nr:hypothetical protein D4L85_24215 [Chryseolinea soli]